MFFKRKDDLIEESFGIIQRQMFNKREREKKEIAEQRLQQNIPRMWAGKKILMQTWGKVLSYEMTMRHAFDMLRVMVRRGWTNYRTQTGVTENRHRPPVRSVLP